MMNDEEFAKSLTRGLWRMMMFMFAVGFFAWIVLGFLLL